MSGLSFDTPSSIAWREICELIDRPEEAIRQEWGVERQALAGPAPQSPDERVLFANGNMLRLIREKNGDEISADINELAPKRRFQISIDDSGFALLAEHGNAERRIRVFLEDVITWLKRGR